MRENTIKPLPEIVGRVVLALSAAGLGNIALMEPVSAKSVKLVCIPNTISRIDRDCNGDTRREYLSYCSPDGMHSGFSSSGYSDEDCADTGRTCNKGRCVRSNWLEYLKSLGR
jgi:hypothetical protein